MEETLVLIRVNQALSSVHVHFQMMESVLFVFFFLLLVYF